MKQKAIHLTDQQLECLFHLVKGKTIKKIAVAMNLSHRTVEHYLENVKAKLGCKTREDLIEYALKLAFVRNRLQPTEN